MLKSLKAVGLWNRESIGVEMGGNAQDFAKMLIEEQEMLKKIAPNNSDLFSH